MRELRRRLQKREIELEAARAIVEGARALGEQADGEARRRLYEAVAAYDRAADSWRWTPLPPPSLPVERPVLRPALTRDRAELVGGWQRGGPHPRPAQCDAGQRSRQN